MIKDYREHLFNNRKISVSPNNTLFKDCWEFTKDRHNRYPRIFYHGKHVAVHRVSANLFMDFDLNSDLKVCHKCDNPPCFNPKHLFIGTYKENNDDRDKKGRKFQVIGSKHGRSKLTETDVLEIRRLFKEGKSKKELMIKFNVCYMNIIRIIRGEIWRHV